ncbi:MAG: lysophospholipid acyltransferase family protein [Rhodothermales bacterium]
MLRSIKLLRFATSILTRTLVLYLLGIRSNDVAELRAKHQQKACRALCRILDIEVLVDALNRPSPGSLIVANHISPLDPLIIASVADVAFAAKAEVLRTPVLGWICRTVGVIPVDRTNRMQSRSFVDAVQQTLAQRVSVAVFPEGTTSDGSTVLPFKTGGFAAVESTNSEIQPACFVITEVTARSGQVSSRIYTWDDDRSLAKYAWDVVGLRKISVRLVFGEPIPGLSDRKSLAQFSHFAVTSILDRSASPENFTRVVS